MPLTNTAIQNAKPSGKTRKLFDGRGLYLEISPNGGKWWRLKYRFNGKEKRLSLGVYPDVTLKAARERRDDARKLIANGIDPSENRKAAKAARSDREANSFEAVAREWFAKHSPNWAANHGDRIIRRLERDIFPWIGGKPAAHRFFANLRIGRNYHQGRLRIGLLWVFHQGNSSRPTGSFHFLGGSLYSLNHSRFLSPHSTVIKGRSVSHYYWHRGV